jgi:hypothetical protein
VESRNHIDGAFYGIGIYPARQELYLADAGNFTTNGKVYIYSYDGTRKHELSSGIGIAPNSVLVVEE